jgi:hypothetical protein
MSRANDEYFTAVLEKNLEQAELILKKAKDGRSELIDELESMISYFDELVEAKKNFKESNSTVNIFEYSFIKRDIAMSYQVIINHKMKMSNIDLLIKEKEADVVEFRARLDKAKRGISYDNVLLFRGNDAKKRIT